MRLAVAVMIAIISFGFILFPPFHNVSRLVRVLYQLTLTLIVGISFTVLSLYILGATAKYP